MMVSAAIKRQSKMMPIVQVSMGQKDTDIHSLYTTIYAKYLHLWNDGNDFNHHIKRKSAQHKIFGLTCV